MRLFMFAASSRIDSINKKLINLAATLISSEHQIDLAEFAEFDMPLYHGDMNATQGLPDNAKKFIERLKNNDALIISSPEYNFSTPGTLKNLIDWVSRDNPMPWRNQHILLMSASPALVGGNRGLWHTRVPLEACGAHVYPDMFSLSDAYNAFMPDGTLKDTLLQQRLVTNLQGFLQYIST